jgi:hypothetical protein
MSPEMQSSAHSTQELSFFARETDFACALKTDMPMGARGLENGRLDSGGKAADREPPACCLLLKSNISFHRQREEITILRSSRGGVYGQAIRA